MQYTTTVNRQLNKQSNEKNREEETTNDIQIVRYVLRQHTYINAFHFFIWKRAYSSTSNICIWFVGIFFVFLILSSCFCSSHVFIVCAYKNCNALVLTDYIENVICFRNTKFVVRGLYPSAHLVFAHDNKRRQKKLQINRIHRLLPIEWQWQ